MCTTKQHIISFQESLLTLTPRLHQVRCKTRMSPRSPLTQTISHPREAEYNTKPQAVQSFNAIVFDDRVALAIFPGRPSILGFSQEPLQERLKYFPAKRLSVLWHRQKQICPRVTMEPGINLLQNSSSTNTPSAPYSTARIDNISLQRTANIGQYANQLASAHSSLLCRRHMQSPRSNLNHSLGVQTAGGHCIRQPTVTK